MGFLFHKAKRPIAALLTTTLVLANSGITSMAATVTVDDDGMYEDGWTYVNGFRYAVDTEQTDDGLENITVTAEGVDVGVSVVGIELPDGTVEEAVAAEAEAMYIADLNGEYSFNIIVARENFDTDGDEEDEDDDEYIASSSDIKKSNSAHKVTQVASSSDIEKYDEDVLEYYADDEIAENYDVMSVAMFSLDDDDFSVDASDIVATDSDIDLSYIVDDYSDAEIESYALTVAVNDVTNSTVDFGIRFDAGTGFILPSFSVSNVGNQSAYETVTMTVTGIPEGVTLEVYGSEQYTKTELSDSGTGQTAITCAPIAGETPLATLTAGNPSCNLIDPNTMDAKDVGGDVQRAATLSGTEEDDGDGDSHEYSDFVLYCAAGSMEAVSFEVSIDITATQARNNDYSSGIDSWYGFTDDTKHFTLMSVDGSQVVVLSGETTLITGSEINSKLKTLAGDLTNIVKIKTTTQTAEAAGVTNSVELQSEGKPVVAYMDPNETGTVLVYTDADTVYMNPNSSYMFQSCSGLTSLEAISGWDTSKVTNMHFMFEGCSSLDNITALSNWNTGNVKDMSAMFSGCSSLEDITALSGENWTTGNVTSMYSTFYKCSSLTSLAGLEKWDTSNVTTMNAMFQSCSGLTSLQGLEKWDTSNVKNMTFMFSRCRGLTSLEAISGWDTSKVTAMSYMFQSCSGLTSLAGLEEWNTSNVTTMESMFYKCSSLENVNGLSGWTTSKVTIMTSMFEGCSGLTNLNGLAKWNTKKVSVIGNMFKGCSSLENAEGLKSWNTSKVAGMSSLFSDCYNLKTLDLSNWNLSNVKYKSLAFSGVAKVSNPCTITCTEAVEKVIKNSTGIGSYVTFVRPAA